MIIIPDAAWRNYNRSLFLLCIGVAVSSFTSSTLAITINLNQVTSGTFAGGGGTVASPPSATEMVGGGNLAVTMGAAKAWWEMHLPGPGVLNVQYGWFNHSSSTLADAGVLDDNGTHPTSARIRFDASRGTGDAWFADPNPYISEEYSGILIDDGDYGGGVLNTARRYTSPTNTSDAWGNLDLFSTAIHELGHALGLASAFSGFNSENTDGDIDISAPLPFAGSVFPTEPGVAHLSTVTFPRALMCDACGTTSVRRLPATVDVLAIAQLGSYSADISPDFHWGGVGAGNGDFTDVLPASRQWNRPLIPGPANDIFFDGVASGSPYTVDINSNVAVNSIIVDNNNDVTLDMTGRLRIISQVYVDSGTLQAAGYSASLGSGFSDIRIGGYEDDGQLTVASGGRLQVSELDVNDGAVARVIGLGEMLIDNTPTSFGEINHGDTHVGHNSSGFLTVRDGGFFTVEDHLYIGRNAGSDGTVTLEGTGAALRVGDTMFVGSSTGGTGSLTVNNGGAQAADVIIGGNGTIDIVQFGEMVIDHQPARFDEVTFGDTHVGHDSTGTLTVNGGTFDTADDFHIGRKVGSNGTVTLNGSTATLRVGGNMYVGSTGGGIATLKIQNLSEVRVTEATTLGSMDDTLTIDGGLLTAELLDNSNGGTFNFPSGVLSVDAFLGDLELQGGTLSPRDSLGTTSIIGNFDQQSGILDLKIGGLLKGTEFDNLIVSATANLSGELNVSLVDGFAPSAGASFQILAAGELLGVFESETLPDLPGSLYWEVDYNTINNQVALSVHTPFSADFDGDGDVDQEDLENPTFGWQARFGIDLDSSDFLAWQQQFGSGLESLSASTVVPEPTSAALGLLGLCLFIQRDR